MREEKSVAIEGENARAITAVWSPDTKTVAVLVSVNLFCSLFYWIALICVN